MTRLVLLDTWLRNCDRHPLDPTKREPNRDNVFLSREGAPPRQASPVLVRARERPSPQGPAAETQPRRLAVAGAWLGTG